MVNTQKVIDKFESIYSSNPLVVSSPGRINLIGEHTDYNDGFVLPAAIDKKMIFAVSKNGTNKIRMFALDLEEAFECDLNDLKIANKQWANYILGVVDQIIKSGHSMEGFDCVISSDIPQGAGMSSSAALECSAGFGLDLLFDLNISKIDIVKFAQKAEHTFAGVQCGIMDQFASVFGKKDHAFKLDCRNLKYEYFPINLPDHQFVLCNTGVTHSLGDSEYNTRRKECEEGITALQKTNPEITHLRDVTLEMLTTIKSEISETTYHRCTYVIEENTRVNSACNSLNNNDITSFGKLMYASHDGLNDQYDVSCKELNFLVDFTRNNTAVLGSRMMGGGFGGCTINLIKRSEKTQFLKEIKEAYSQKYDLNLECYEVEISKGSSVISKEYTTLKN